jgi:hypothetical protein
LDTKGTYILQRKTPVFLTEFLRIKRINTHLCKGKKMRRGEGRGEERRKGRVLASFVLRTMPGTQ